MNFLLKTILWILIWNWGCANARSVGCSSLDRRWWRFMLPVMFAFLLGSSLYR